MMGFRGSLGKFTVPAVPCSSLSLPSSRSLLLGWDSSHPAQLEPALGMSSCYRACCPLAAPALSSIPLLCSPKHHLSPRDSLCPPLPAASGSISDVPGLCTRAPFIGDTGGKEGASRSAGQQSSSAVSLGLLAHKAAAQPRAAPLRDKCGFPSSWGKGLEARTLAPC